MASADGHASARNACSCNSTDDKSAKKSCAHCAKRINSERDAANVPVLSTDTCTIHKEEVLNIYCSVHDVTCCRLCIQLKHRSCRAVQNIQAKNQRNSYGIVHDLYNVKLSHDRETCDIMGICLMDNGYMVISDDDNNNLKLLNQDFEVIDVCAMPCLPWGVCSTGHYEIAVALDNDKKIQFLSTTGNTLTSTRSFKVGLNCRYLVFSHGELFITCLGYESHQAQVRVYNLSGNHVRTIQNDATGKPIFSEPLGIAASNDETNIHVTDVIKGVITVNRNGQLISTISDPSIKYAWGICVWEDDRLFVTGYKSNNIVNIDTKKKKVVTILAEKDGIYLPKVLRCDKANSRLICSLDTTDDLAVYNLSKKSGPVDKSNPIAVDAPVVKVFTVEDQRKVNISHDKETCDIMGICLMDNGYMVISDDDNNNLKLLNPDFKVIDVCAMPCLPWGVCSTGDNEIAVALDNDKKIQFLSTTGNTLTPTRSFKVGLNCRYLVFSHGELFVTCLGYESHQAQVRVYNLSGNHVRTIQNDASGKPIFSEPLGIAASNDGTNLHVTDVNKGVITVNRLGQHISTFSDPTLKYAWGICVWKDDSLFISGYKSNNIINIDISKQKKTCIVLSDKDGIYLPKVLCDDKTSSHLICSMDTTDEISFFKLRKM